MNTTSNPSVAAIILDANYIYNEIYKSTEEIWKGRTSLNKHKNTYFDGYEFINHYINAVSMNIHDLINTFKAKVKSTIVENEDEAEPVQETLIKIYLTKSSKTSWRNNVLNEYKSNIEKHINPVLDIIFKDNIGLDGIEVFQNFNLESDDCISIITKKIFENYENSYINIISNNKRLLQLESEKISVLDLNQKKINNQFTILTKNNFYTPNKFLFFLILKGDEDTNIPPVFLEEKTDMEYESYYDDNSLIAYECQDIILAEKLRTNYLLCDYNSIPTKLITNFVKNNDDII